MTYNRFIQGLRLAGVSVDRKVLADLAVNDAAAFAALVEVARDGRRRRGHRRRASQPRPPDPRPAPGAERRATPGSSRPAGSPRRRAGREAGRFLAEGRARRCREALRCPDAVVELFATAEALRRHRDPGADRAVGRDAGRRDLREGRRRAVRDGDPAGPGRRVPGRRRPADDVCSSAGRALAAALVDAERPGQRRHHPAHRRRRRRRRGGVRRRRVDPYNGKAVRACAGSLFHVDGGRLPSGAGPGCGRTGGGLRRARHVEQPARGRAVDAVELAAPTMWLFGNEAAGLPPAVIRPADQSVRVPIYGRAREPEPRGRCGRLPVRKCSRAAGWLSSAS